MLLSETHLIEGAHIRFKNYILIAAYHHSSRARGRAAILICNELKFYQISPFINADSQVALITLHNNQRNLTIALILLSTK